MFSETTFLLVFGLGAVCMLLGFFLVLRGVGASDSESTIKLIGIEIRASRVGPGVLFALFGVVLIVTAIGKQPSSTPAQGPANGGTIQATATPAAPAPLDPGQAAETPAAPPVTQASVEETPPMDTVEAQRSHEMRLIRQFLADAAQGRCNEAILGPAPLLDCRTNIVPIQQRLAYIGGVQSITLTDSGATPLGRADQFTVRHAGAEVTWIGVLGADGRFITLVSP